MKKLIGIIGIGIIAMTMLLNVSLQNSENEPNGTVNLAYIVSASSAQENGGGGGCSYPAMDPPLSGYQDYVVEWCYGHDGKSCGTETWCSYSPGGDCYGWTCGVFI